MGERGCIRCWPVSLQHKKSTHLCTYMLKCIHDYMHASLCSQRVFEGWLAHCPFPGSDPDKLNSSDSSTCHGASLGKAHKIMACSGFSKNILQVSMYLGINVKEGPWLPDPGYPVFVPGSALYAG